MRQNATKSKGDEALTYHHCHHNSQAPPCWPPNPQMIFGTRRQDLKYNPDHKS